VGGRIRVEVEGAIEGRNAHAFLAPAAARIAENPPLGGRGVKRIAAQLAKEPAQRELGAAQASVSACLESEDYREGMRAFLEKRPPVLRGL
jgi:enoyl-CoA hydratase/carnithine racemase